nr:MoxR family ATPase [bacterium]
MQVGTEQVQAFADTVGRMQSQVARDIVGQQEAVRLVLISVLVGGNALLEGVPGLGKTRLVRTLSRVLSLPFSRIQFTPDLMPSDVVGADVLARAAQGNSRFEFRPGPIFASLVLADEINRATPKTQSALLEAMQEHTVTVGGQTRALPKPFFVLATQNPIEQEGTYPLPEAQLDRFLVKICVPFPTMEELSGIVALTGGGEAHQAECVCSGEDILAMRQVVQSVPVAQAVIDFALRLVLSTHPERPESPEIARKYLRFGASPRGAQALIACARALALMNGRYNVAFSDIEEMALPCLRHRIALNFEAQMAGLTAENILAQLIDASRQE